MSKLGGYLLVDFEGKDISTSKTISGIYEKVKETKKRVVACNVKLGTTVFKELTLDVKKDGTNLILSNSIIKVTITNANAVVGENAMSDFKIIGTMSDRFNESGVFNIISEVNDYNIPNYKEIVIYFSCNDVNYGRIISPIYNVNTLLIGNINKPTLFSTLHISTFYSDELGTDDEESIEAIWTLKLDVKFDSTTKRFTTFEFELMNSNFGYVKNGTEGYYQIWAR